MSGVAAGPALVEISVRLAAAVPGWMRVSELRWLAEQALGRRCIVEIGSFQGRSAKALATSTPGTLYCVDPWDRVSEIPPHVPIWGAFRGNLAEELRAGKVVPVRMRSRQGLPWLRQRGLEPDMVFIDAEHHYEAVAEDLRLALELIGGRAGVLLCGHDYEDLFPGVVRAVDELFPGIQQPRKGDGGLWAVEL